MSNQDGKVDLFEAVTQLLKEFKLSTAATEMARRLLAAGYEDALSVVHEVLLEEQQARRERRVARLARASKLPLGKTFDALDLNRLPLALSRKLRELKNGSFLERAVNVLAFGLPGTGKSHAACALGHALVQQRRSVLFVPTFELVQDLLAAKRDLALPRALRKLDKYELLILDDIGYVKQGADEVEVLFTLLAERYERRSVLIYVTWNQPPRRVDGLIRGGSWPVERPRSGGTASRACRAWRRARSGLRSSTCSGSRPTRWTPTGAGWRAF